MPVPSAAGKPWEGMDWRDEGTPEWRDSLSDEQVDEWHEWQAQSDEEQRAQDDTEQQERDARLQREIEEERRSGQVDQYRLEHGAPSADINFVDLQGNPVDAVVKDQPIQIQVTLPTAAGAKPPQTVDVVVSGQRLTFIGREYQATDSVTLTWVGNVKGPPVYRSAPLTIEKGGDGAVDLGVPGFEFNTGGMGGFSVDDGDFVTVQVEGGQGFGGATSGAQVFQSVTRLELALTLQAIGAANQMYTNILVNIANLEKQLADMAESDEKTTLADKLAELKTKAQQGLRLAQNAVSWVNTTDTLDHQKLAVARLYASWMGLFREPTVNADGSTAAPDMGPIFVPDPRDEGDYVRDASQSAKEEVRRILWQGLGQATIGGYRLLAQATLVAQIMTIAGYNELGQRATTMERWMAFFDVLSQAALMGAMAKFNLSGMVPRTTGRLPTTKLMTDTPTAMKAPTGTPVAPEAAGMLKHAARDAQLIARKHDVVIQTRFTNRDAMLGRALGWKPKPMALKSKTITPVDRKIGAPDAAADAAVGLFEPKLPKRTTETDAEWATIEKRFGERAGEWNGAIGAYQRKLVEKGDFTMRDGMMCDKDGTPITGDYDLFEITSRDGTPVAPDVYDAVVNDLISAEGFQAAHGAHMRWNPKPTDDAYHIDFSGNTEGALDALGKWQADRNIFRGIIQRHQVGGEGLITFSPNQPPVITYAGEAVGPKLADFGPTTMPLGSAQGGGLTVRPTLFVATSAELLSGQGPTGAGWEWTQQYDWQSEIADWQSQVDALGQGTTMATPQASGVAAIASVTAQSSPGRGWRPIVIGGVGIGVLVVGGIAGLSFFGNQPALGPIASTTLPPPTQSAVAQATQATTAPTLAPTEHVTAPPSAPPPALAIQSAITQVAAISNSTIALSAPVDGALDEMGDTFLPNDGTAALADQPWVDLLGAGAFRLTVSDSQATALSSWPCGSTSTSNDLSWYTACNQSSPLPAGDYAAFYQYYAQWLPDPLPQEAQVVYMVMFDVDDDRTTGFQSNLPYNNLTGADIYFEDLFFWNQAGAFQNYILATDYSLPARPDTGDIHGNLVTQGRAFAGPVGDYMFVTTFLPLHQIVGSWSAGAFGITDRSAIGPATLAVDGAGALDTELAGFRRAKFSF